jgi:multidrug efflux pump subunit AcrA (membrane-fusion protein)
MNVLTVPRGTVEGDGGQRFVFVVLRNALSVGKATLQKRQIRVGIADSTNYEVVSGLQEGEMVALPGDVDLKDGMPVRIVNTDDSFIRGRSEPN